VVGRTFWKDVGNRQKKHECRLVVEKPMEHSKGQGGLSKMRKLSKVVTIYDGELVLEQLCVTVE
jgi:hypothetical protein